MAFDAASKLLPRFHMKSLRYFIEKEYFEEKAEEMANSELHQMQKKKVQKEEANKNRGTSQE